MIRTQIQLPEEDFARVRVEAMREGCSISAFVRRSVQQALNAGDGRGHRQEAGKLAGKYRSGLHDLARNHDAHLDRG